MLLSDLNHVQKNALFAVIVQCLPVEPRNDVDLEESCWSHDFLLFLVRELNLPDTYYEAYSTLVDQYHIRNQEDKDKKDIAIAPFLQVIQLQAVEAHQDQLMVAILLQITLILKGRYDSKSRVLIRQLIYTICTKLFAHDSPSISITAMEEYIVYALDEQYKRIADHATISHNQDAKKSNRAKYIRYAQIGAVSLTAGAAIALTGGLAAPAIAAVWGGFSFLTTAGVAASLFGSAGAGLAGYKMMKRTKGLTEFAFESPDDVKQPKGRPAVMIMVSGYMIDKEDYKRAAGIIPNEMSMEERLVRFFRIHEPAKVTDAAILSMELGDAEQAYYTQLKAIYRKDPMSRADLSPDYVLSSIDDEYRCIIDRSLIDGIQALSADADAIDAKSTVDSAAISTEHQAYVDDDEIEQVDMKSHDDMARMDDREVLSSTASYAMTGDEISDTSLLQPHYHNDDDRLHMMSISMEAINNASNQNTSTMFSTQDSTSSAGRQDVDPSPTPAQTFEETVAFGTHLWHFRELNISGTYELYALRWETDTQVDLGNTIAQMLVNLGVSVATRVIAETFFYTLASAIMLPAVLMSLTNVIDSVWTISVLHADLAGKELARALMLRPQGSRPVTLVGYSMGARVIFSCLCELFKLMYGYMMDSGTQHRHHSTSQSSSSSSTAAGKKKSMSSYIRLPFLSKRDGKHDTSSSTHDRSTDRGRSDSISSEQPSLSPLDDAEYDDVNDEFFRSAQYQTNPLPSPSSAAEATRTSSTADTRHNPFHNSHHHHEHVVDEKVRGIENIIQDVVLLGAPVRYKSKFWKWVRMMVSGRLINGYSKKDIILGLVYRYERYASAVAGVEEVPCPGIENVDLSHIVFGHLDYHKNMKDILEYIDLTQPETTVLY